MANPASLAGLVLGLHNPDLQPEHREQLRALTHALGKAPKRNAGSEIFKMMRPAAFKEMTNTILARYLITFGLPFAEGEDKLWIELPAVLNSKTDKSGYLLQKDSDGNGFSLQPVGVRKPDDKYREMIKHGLLPPSSIYVKKFDLIMEYTGIISYIKFTEDKENPYTLTTEHMSDHLLRTTSWLDTTTMMDKKKYLDDLVPFVNGQTNNMVRQALSLLILMTHEKIWRRECGVAPNKKKHATMPFPPVLGADYMRQFDGMKTLYDITIFLGILTTRPSTVADIVTESLAASKDADDSTLLPFKIITNNLPQAVTLRYDESVQKLAKKVMREIPPEDITRLFQKAGLKANTLWVEGPFHSTSFQVLPEDNTTFTPSQVGALFKQFDNGYDLTTAIIWKGTSVDPHKPQAALSNTDFRITGDHWCVDASFEYPKYSATPDAPEDELWRGPAEMHTLLKTVLLLERAKTEILEDAGLLPKTPQPADQTPTTKPADGDPAIRRARIYPAKPDGDRTIRIDVTRPPQRISSKRPEYVLTDEKLVKWEAEKELLRSDNETEIEFICKFPDDPASQKALLDIEKQFTATAKSLFGDTVTARVSFVPESKPMWRKVTGGHYTHSAHIRSYLYKEYTNPHVRALRTAAYDLTATREDATVTKDAHGYPVLILSAGG